MKSASSNKEIESRTKFNYYNFFLMIKTTLINGESLSASLETTLAVEQFLKENYLFRRNVLNGKV